MCVCIHCRILSIDYEIISGRLLSFEQKLYLLSVLNKLFSIQYIYMPIVM